MYTQGDRYKTKLTDVTRARVAVVNVVRVLPNLDLEKRKRTKMKKKRLIPDMKNIKEKRG